MKHNERLAILGGVSSGAGVLIRTMLGLHKHVSGDIVIDGKHISNILRDYKKLHGVVGYQPQQNSIDEELSVLQHLNLFAKLGGIESEHIESEVNKMLDACQLKDVKDTRTEDLSFGMVRRLTLAMALIGRPKLVILDNPLQGVDPDCKKKLIETILTYTENRALLVATRDVDTAQLLGQRIAVLKQGSIVAIGTAGEIIERHGKGYSIEVHADMQKLREQALQAFNEQDNHVIDNLDEAYDILNRL